MEAKNEKSNEKKSSNKLLVYQSWKKGNTDKEKLAKVVAEAVKVNTIKGWMNGWAKGKRLPAGATEKVKS